MDDATLRKRLRDAIVTKVENKVSTADVAVSYLSSTGVQTIVSRMEKIIAEQTTAAELARLQAIDAKIQETLDAPFSFSENFEPAWNQCKLGWKQAQRLIREHIAELQATQRGGKP